MAEHRTRDRILTRAGGLLSQGGKPTVEQFAHAAGISKSSFYRAFRSRDALLAALEVSPEPAARERILDAALAMVGVHGLAALSMDELADRAQVSRATLYRLFPGKSALFTSLIYAYSPLEPVTQVLASMSEEPPEIVMPEIARTVYRTIYGGSESRVGLLRTLLFEVSGLGPDTEDAAREVISRLVGLLKMYIVSQMSAGRLRPTSPLLALQSFIGPIFFHLMTRPVARRVLGMEIDGEEAVTELAQTWLRGMRPA
ncbi:MAG TPA: TetR/AcrR family transcriptional regulator [Candidatus Dormibacteraeota bacterium]|nr:TetR/AcrR family transcriptional regulator [Candidatus Dormibacteraeota bacterium]